MMGLSFARYSVETSGKKGSRKACGVGMRLERLVMWDTSQEGCKEGRDPKYSRN